MALTRHEVCAERCVADPGVRRAHSHVVVALGLVDLKLDPLVAGTLAGAGHRLDQVLDDGVRQAEEVQATTLLTHNLPAGGTTTWEITQVS